MENGRSGTVLAANEKRPAPDVRAADSLAIELNERAAIGAILKDPAVCLGLARAMGVKAETFTTAQALEAFKAAEAIEGRGARSELVAMMLELGGDDAAQDAWMSFLGECMERCVTTAYAMHYFRTLREAEAARLLKATLEDAAVMLDANPKRVWDACTALAVVLRGLKAMQLMLGPFPPPQPNEPVGDGKDSPR